MPAVNAAQFNLAEKKYIYICISMLRLQGMHLYCIPYKIITIIYSIFNSN